KRDYQTLYDELDNFNAVKVLESLYYFKREKTNATGLKNHFKQFIDDDDGLIIIESKTWSGYGLDGSPNDFK
ncbi:MAG: hypothetical protein IIB94_07260, partial [Candidatus Marinimicrobia bacterium]|nr:hypothetical protein [Candidatus Neomarinimicrobiota bacterium]